MRELLTSVDEKELIRHDNNATSNQLELTI